MDNGKFVKYARALVRDYMIHELGWDGLGDSNIYVVWLSKALQNNKATLSSDVKDGRYYEVTYNGDKEEFYLDVYKKELNRAVSIHEMD